MEEKYPDSLRKTKIETICTDSKFGELNFQPLVTVLNQMISEIVELENSDYRANLTQAEINQVDSARNNLKSYVNQIENFSITQPNASQTRDGIIQNIQSYYQNSYASQIRQPLLYLRDKIRLNAKNSETEYRKLLPDLQKLIAEVKEEKSKLEKDRVSVAEGRGIISAKYLSERFATSGATADTEAEVWQSRTFRLSIALISLVVILGIIYFIWIRPLNSADKIEYGIFSVSIIASIFYYLQIVLRNYNITKHIATGNKHRANIASTLEGFLAQATQDPDLKAALLKEGSTALFQADSTGYLTKDQIDVSTPVKEIVTTLINHKG